MRFLNNKYTRVLTLLLLLQGVAYYAVASRPERVPPVAPLVLIPSEIAGWKAVKDTPLDTDTKDVLKADDTLDRLYVNASRTPAYLFVAYFKTQRMGQSPHSPKNCLPGAGWEPVDTGFESIAIPGRAAPIRVNRYVVEHGDEKSVVMYWYQSHNRVIASEYSAKFWLVADAIRYNRSDTSLVRVVVPVRNNDIQGATETCVEFTQVLFRELTRRLPS